MRTDARPMLRPKGRGNLLFGGPARALKSSNGRSGAMVFPYTPTITYQRGANYGLYDLPHTNYQPLYYQSTSSPSVQVTGLFTCLLYTSPSPRDVEESRMPSSA